GDVGNSPCHGSLEMAGSPSPALPEQCSPQTEAVESEPVGSVAAAATPVSLSEPSLGAVSWITPLVWLERTLPASSLLESLRHSLSLSASWRDAGTRVTPVPTVVTPVPTGTIATSVTPVPTMSMGTSVTPGATETIATSVTPVPTVSTGTTMTPEERSSGTSMPACAKDSAAETDSLLWHCPREQLRSLPRAELEGRLESTLIIIEALSLQLRDWQDSQRPLPSVGPAGQRDAHTQTDITRPQGEERIYHGLYVELRRKAQALQRQRGAERELVQQLERAAEAMVRWGVRGLGAAIPGAIGVLVPSPGAVPLQRLQVHALVSRCEAVLHDVPAKLQSCLQERDAAQQRADE
ncbi:SPAG5 protein, partial [Odontophorus gujanensis]|nr:SPAG5 protein [Odontophorus gujanensis]